jgi:hypothetical protein
VLAVAVEGEQGHLGEHVVRAVPHQPVHSDQLGVGVRQHGVADRAVGLAVQEDGGRAEEGLEVDALARADEGIFDLLRQTALAARPLEQGLHRAPSAIPVPTGECREGHDPVIRIVPRFRSDCHVANTRTPPPDRSH